MSTETESPGAGIHILGGGPAGLAAGYHAAKRGLDFVVLEAGSRPGGNCRTLRLGEFLFDTGAHRLHDKDPEVTSEIRALLKGELFEVRAPSQIFHEGRYFRFPLQLGSLIRGLDRRTLVRIAAESLRPRPRKSPGSFGEFAVHQYGPTLAGLFLLNYSRKLWGTDPFRLSTEVSGGRMKGLDLAGFLRETLLGRARRASHLDGSFLYPRHGFGAIVDGMSEAIGARRIRLDSRVTRIMHSGGRIDRVVVNGGEEVEVSTVVNTLPLTLSAKILDPPPPPEVLAAADAVRYRNLVLCVFCLDRPSFSPNASLYFPGEEFPFTRLYEPRNRSPHMAPEGKTAIVLEMPCFADDPLWSLPDGEVLRRAWRALQRVKPLGEGEVLRFTVLKLPFAYPVLEAGLAGHVELLVDYFRSFENLHLTGRSSMFRYVHLHDLFREGRELVGCLAEGGTRGPAAPAGPAPGQTEGIRVGNAPV